MDRACENCGNPDDELLLVRRVYPDFDHPLEAEQVEVTPELWCLSCTSQYPHEAADA